MKTIENKKDKVLEIIDNVVCFVSAGIFAFCLVWAIVCMSMGIESPINGYGLYRPIEIMQRLGGLAAVMLTFVIKKIGVKLPPQVTILYNIFVVLTVFGGTIMGLYINTEWWDKFNQRRAFGRNRHVFCQFAYKVQPESKRIFGFYNSFFGCSYVRSRVGNIRIYLRRHFQT